MTIPTKTPAQMTAAELKAHVNYLKKATHLGTWGETQLSIAEAEVTKRNQSPRK